MDMDTEVTADAIVATRASTTTAAVHLLIDPPSFDYTGADFREWCGEAGFKRFEILPLAGPTSAAIAYK